MDISGVGQWNMQPLLWKHVDVARPDWLAGAGAPSAGSAAGAGSSCAIAPFVRHQIVRWPGV